jgi:hypothetical protein
MRSGRAPPPSPNPAGIAVTRCSSGNFVSLPRRGGREIGVPDVTGTYRIISGIGVRARLIRGLEALHPRQSTASIPIAKARLKRRPTRLLSWDFLALARWCASPSGVSRPRPAEGIARPRPCTDGRAAGKSGDQRRRRRLGGELGRGTLEEEKPPVFGMIRRSGMIAFQIFFMISLEVALKNLDGIVKTLHTQP